MNKVFGYARVSTLEQNLDTQLEALRQVGCQEIFQEKVFGVATSRPALGELLARLREGDTVVVARFFRLGRSRDHVISLVNEFARKRINFRALDVGIDTTTPAGKLIMCIFASLAEYDREVILEKTRVGQLLAKGKHMGRPPGVNQEKLVKVKKALEKGLSVAEIVNLTGISLSSVKQYRKAIQAKANF